MIEAIEIGIEGNSRLCMQASFHRTLCCPLKTVAKLPLPISSSMRKEPTTLSPVLDRLEADDEDGGG